jgi:hypothetical protein
MWECQRPLKRLNLRMLLRQLGFNTTTPTVIYSDNQGAITMGLHLSNKPATRHIDMPVGGFSERAR